MGSLLTSPEAADRLDTSIVDLPEQLNDPFAVLFGEQFGGGAGINAALAYCEQQIEHPAKNRRVSISDLYEGGEKKSMLARVAAIEGSGVNVIVLLTLYDSGHPGCDTPKRAGDRLD